MPNNKKSKRTGISLVAILFKYVKIHEDYRELFTTTRLYFRDMFKNAINFINDGMAYTGIPHLCDGFISIVKRCLGQLRELGCVLIKRLSRFFIKKWSQLLVVLHRGALTKRQRRLRKFELEK